jgi:hypothetical protein
MILLELDAESSVMDLPPVRTAMSSSMNGVPTENAIRRECL